MRINETFPWLLPTCKFSIHVNIFLCQHFWSVLLFLQVVENRPGISSCHYSWTTQGKMIWKRIIKLTDWLAGCTCLTDWLAVHVCLSDWLTNWPTEYPLYWMAHRATRTPQIWVVLTFISLTRTSFYFWSCLTL